MNGPRSLVPGMELPIDSKLRWPGKRQFAAGALNENSLACLKPGVTYLALPLTASVRGVGLANTKII